MTLKIFSPVLEDEFKWITNNLGILFATPKYMFIVQNDV